ncbi:hypothetical protein RJ639_047409 [Escallonia herrerae]|uniref:Uncharacterized protein n=1 Tax=Escallonia herrerae TaxID=1293975 RepID=A0AA89AYL8_9ASTE|nr:hypothetical protein RJ639_047409 [Escallonia herrerae]
MRTFSACFTAFLLFSLAIQLVEARRDPGDYWKSIMNGEPMPKAIKDFLNQDPAASQDSSKIRERQTSSETIYMDHFVKDFDIKPNVIIYHSHMRINHEGEEPLAKDTESRYLSQKERNL